jgi:hypothetical protein
MHPALHAVILLACAASAWSRDYMGLKRPARDSARLVKPPKDTGFPAPQPLRAPDTTYLSRKIRSLPVETEGVFLGMLEGVRCFNCRPKVVEVGLSDSLTRNAGYIALRTEVWNAIQRPVRDRRVYDYANACFFFGTRPVDTVLVAGEPAEIQVKDKPCYPYLQRNILVPGPGSPEAPRPTPVPAPEPKPAPPSVDTAKASAPPDSSRDSTRAPESQAPAPAP